MSRSGGLFAAEMAEPAPEPVSAEAVLRELGLFELRCQGEDVPARREGTGELGGALPGGASGCWGRGKRGALGELGVSGRLFEGSLGGLGCWGGWGCQGGCVRRFWVSWGSIKGAGGVGGFV